MDPATYIIGSATTEMHRRDLSAGEMATSAVAGALADAGLRADEINLVVVGNATAGRLLDQGYIRGQVFLARSRLRHAGIINVDNSCAGGVSALHLAVLAARGGAGNVLALGVEKMWTGDRAQTLAGIEDGVPKIDREFMHAEWENESGSVLMALNARWTTEHMERWGTTPEMMAAAAVKARRHGALNPHAQFRTEVSLEEVLSSPTIVSPLTRLMCSSFTDGAAAVIVTDRARTGAPKIRGAAVRSGNGDLDYHDRLAETASAAWDAADVDPADIDVVELHDATSPEEICALESLGLYKPGDAGPATLAGDTTLGGRGVTVNTSGGLVSRGHPLGATGIAQVAELVAQLRDEAGARQVPGARLAVAANTGGMVGSHAGTTDAAFIGIHVLEAS